MLRRENIATLDELRVVADHLERFDNIGVKTARLIRQELDRAASEEQSADEDASADRERACCPVCGGDLVSEARAPGADEHAARLRSHLGAHLRKFSSQPKSVAVDHG